ncbi:hypothetical protein V2J09_012707 [Rumex salicifolius]
MTKQNPISQLPSSAPSPCFFIVLIIFFFHSNNVDRASDEGREELASDVFVKFLMNQNISLDFSKDSQFENLLRNVAQQGQQSCLFLDNSTLIQNSLWKFENEIKQYMRMVVKSWMTTPCTLMSYNVKGAGKNQLFLGFIVQMDSSFSKEVEQKMKLGRNWQSW